ncbi:MAG: helix-turn-helix domain-containing protein [Eubacterium sp.]|nr:helix-turn-helix domain-containing protein [Eubacterium sp.]
MPQTYEISTFESHTPFKCTLHQIGHISEHMHDYFEIIFVLSGSCNLSVEDQMFRLQTDDIIAVESHTVHELRASDCVYVSIQMDQTTLEKNFAVPLHPKFECNSRTSGNEEAFQRMRHIIALIVKNNADQRTGYELRNWIYIYQLMEILFTHFRVERSAALDKRNHRYASRVDEIVRIIKEHYTEDLSLSRLADMVHLSSPYLSKFFLEQFGVNYLTYLTHLRLNHAVHDLVNSEKNIEEISADSGFPNSHAFTQIFRKEYNMLPSAYRRKQKQAPTDTPIFLEQHNYMAGLKKHLQQDTAQTLIIPPVSARGAFSVHAPAHPLKHTWRTVAAVGQAADILLGKVQSMLRRLQHDIGYEYLFFNGILSDNLFLFTMDENEQPRYNFAYVDLVLDFLRSIRLKPFLPFSYMPAALAKQPNRFSFQHLVSEPKKMDLWCGLISAFMEHVISRYGMAEVLQWKFSVWHLPDTPPRLYGFGKTEDFYLFYQRTYETVKRFHSDFCFGLPCTFYLSDLEHSNWYRDLLRWGMEHHCAPDFIGFTFYDMKMAGGKTKSRASFGFTDPMILNPRENGLKEFLSCVKRDLKEMGKGGLPVYVCEWNNTPSQQDLLNDTCYKSCYLVKNILENYDRSDGLAYWSLTDLMAERPLPEDYLFGGLGLFTTDGLPKAGYYALWLLRQLGDSFLAKGNCWYAARTQSKICVMAWHYKHISNLYAMGERFDMTETDRYTMFEPSESLYLELELQDVEDKEYSLTEYILNRHHGSLYDAWIEMGIGSPASDMERGFLEARSVPTLKKSRVTAKNGTLILRPQLELLEVRLMVISL